MIHEIIEKWEQNKGKLEKFFKTTPQREYWEYIHILKAIFDIVINDDKMSFQSDKITSIHHGEYQGTKLFITPFDVYQPYPQNYILTDVWYGSCECNNVIEMIRYDRDDDNIEEGSELPNDSQVRKYMLLSLHLVQKMRWLPGTDVLSFEYSYRDFEK